MAGRIDDSPCNGCTRRHARCHAECPDYPVWAAEHEKKREELRKKRAEYYATEVYRKDAIGKQKKR